MPDFPDSSDEDHRSGSAAQTERDLQQQYETPVVHFFVAAYHLDIGKVINVDEEEKKAQIIFMLKDDKKEKINLRLATNPDDLLVSFDKIITTVEVGRLKRFLELVKTN